MIIILGPTATGKTDLGLHLAKKFNGEIISCDSRQVYIGLDIGTGKFPGDDEYLQLKKGQGYWEIDGIKIWLYDLIDPKGQYTVADYIKDATRVINGILKRKKLPIIVGGTGLYLKALIAGLGNLSVPVDRNLRRKLEGCSLLELQNILKELSNISFEKLTVSDKQNPRRLIRSIELIYMNPYTDKNNKWFGIKNKFDVLKIGLTAPRKILYKNADTRVLTRIDQGMINEARGLYKNGLSLKRMRELGLEYAVLADYLEGQINQLEFINILQNKIHSYIRRQLTWFKKDHEINWFDITEKNIDKKLVNLVYKWYHNDKSYAKKN